MLKLLQDGDEIRSVPSVRTETGPNRRDSRTIQGNKLFYTEGRLKALHLF